MENNHNGLKVPNSDKPADEVKIEKDAFHALEQSREQIRRATVILEGEVRRLDDILARG